MRFVALAFIGGLGIASGAGAQSVAELRAQYEQTQSLLNQAEASGVDASMVASLRETLDSLKQTIDEMERDQASAGSSDGSAETAPASAASSEQPNLAEATCSKFGFTEANYRERALAAGNDAQIRTMCGQAYEYYTMYKRALGQGHPEAWKTYDAHRQSVKVLENFWAETRVSGD